MKCRNCSCCNKGWFDYAPDAYVCIGVKKPFFISDINAECTEYPEKRRTVTVEDAIAHFKYGITHDIFSEPVTSYAKMAVEALKRCRSDIDYKEGYEDGYHKGAREFAKYLKEKASHYDVADYDWGWFGFMGIDVKCLDDFIDDFSNKKIEIEDLWL